MKKLITISLLALCQITTAQIEGECAGIIDENVPIQLQVCTEQSQAYDDFYKRIESYKVNSSTAVKTLKVALHIWLGPNGEGNWVENQATLDLLEDVEGWINQKYQYNTPSSETFSPSEFIADPKIRISIEGIYFYYNAGTFGIASYSFLNNYINGINPERLEYLPIHCVSGGCGAAGFASGTSYHNDSQIPSVVTCMNPVQNGSFSIAVHLAHEIGHDLDLRHTYDGNCSGIYPDVFNGNGDSCCPEPNDPNSNEYVGDIFDYSNNWCASPAGFCYECTLDDPYDNINGHASNNLMGGTGALDLYLSPLQIGKTHRASQIKSVRQFMWGYNPEPLEITGIEEWDFSIKVYNDIIVKTGAQLTIKCEVQFVPEAKIIIEPGGKLIVDGGILTRPKFSTDYWRGIEVWGNSNQQQNTNNQGVLITKNGAVIEYAKDAIRVWEPDNWSSTGGMVSCTKTTFNNNSRSCEYIYYHNYNLAGNEIPNTGRFTNCTFQWGDDMIGTGLAPAITMFHINGVQINGCDFFDNRTNPVQRAGGVFTIDAGYKVLGRYTGGGIFYPPNFPQHQTFNETNYDVSHFKDMGFGIHAMNSTTIFSVVVDHSWFENNSYGIVLDAVDNAVITRNKYDFNLGQPLDIAAMYQLSLRECNGYKIEGNQFYRSSPYGAVGSLIQNSGAPANEVYRNDYDGVNVGNWGLGFNSNDLSSAQFAKGLQWRCNDYLNGYIDQYNQVLSYDPALNGEGVRLLQGSSSIAAGNTFSPTIVSGGSPYDRHFYNGDQDLIGYYRTTLPNETPTQTEGPVTLGLAPENLCPSTFQSKIVIAKSKMITDAERPILENRVVEIDQELNTNKNELDLLLQEGDTPALHALVAGLTNGNKDQVKASLLLASPYLSQSLLEELGQKQPSLFPHSWYKEIIDANIEVARNNDFMETTLTKPFPMPAGMYNDINLNRYTTFTERGEKELVILDLNDEREVIMNLFIADIMSDSSEIDWASVKQLLIDRDHIECKRQIADYHLTREEIPSCHDILDLIELQLSSYEMDRVKGELEDFVFFKRYLLTITGDSGIVKVLQPLEITQLEYIADNFEGKAARQARNILCFHEGLCNDIDYEIPMDTHPGNGNKSVEQFTEGNMGKQLQNLDIVPNPNEGIFELGTPENCTVGQISIVDVTGRTVLFEEISTDGNKSTIRLIDVQKGIHLINVTCDDGSKYTGRILVVE